MDENKFFREATLRICGNIQIDEAIYSALKFIRTEFPVDRIFLQFFDAINKEMRIIAHATNEGGVSVDWIIPLSAEALKELGRFAEEFKEKEKDFHWFFEDDPGKHKLIKDIIDFLGCEISSIVVIPLRLKNNQLLGGGSLIMTTEGESKLTPKQSRVLSSLREPFAIAFSNSIKHLDEIKLLQRDFFWDASKGILGNLKIEEGLQESLKILQKFMPADKVYLQIHKPELEAMHLIAYADNNKCEELNTFIPFTPEAIEKFAVLAEDFRNGYMPEVFVINDCETEPITKCMIEALNEPISSAMSLPLIVKDHLAGSVALLASGKNRYSEEHSKLFASLKEPFFVAMMNNLKHREVLNLKDLLADDNKYLHDELRKISGDEIIGSNFGLKEVMHKVQQVASLDSPVILLGETGVGKDVVANAIHYSSSRSGGPFVSVNCGAIPDSLIDSELFGHEKGAFTGALTQKRGRFERANNGTIFLDEIGELPLQAQVRLLKVIQSKEIERVGGVKTISLNIRIIAATNRNLEEMVKTGEFREDLWFRLNVFPIAIPPLRNRASDIPALINHFINRKSQELKLKAVPALAPGAIKIFMEYSWPGNVRELENIVERELIINPHGPLTFYQLRENKIYSARSTPDNKEVETLNEVNARHIQETLVKTMGKIHGPGGAAELLGINSNTLRHRMMKLGIKFKKY